MIRLSARDGMGIEFTTLTQKKPWALTAILKGLLSAAVIYKR